ncbi:hypothetical protein [Niabella ginsengisoli]|uniref:Peptide-N-glycosidase F C-terminal domain-containing protein n=1 Tax=Niabella ginsengisoli TaxID=522298 RepID=A0ABS9SPM4_9BACT|nr:hypothetical protein [Niabella ginsengisoli]MCH5600322.1 hypothetical protein [Niabella ginsengisoli]
MIFFNNELIDTRPMWRECGDNPLYPQAGTWIYDRANWCPGYLQIPDEYYFPLQQSNSIDVNMESYRVSKTQAAENITAYIIQYKKVAAAHDVTITDIKRPTDKLTHGRENPAVFKPSVVIENSGFKKLTSVKIKYGTAGFKQKTYQWKGDLSYGMQAEIELPGIIDAVSGENYFTVSLTQPNNKKDAYEMDNTMSSRFTAAPLHSQDLVFVLKTNNQPEYNSYTITDINDQIIFQRVFDSTMKNKIFKDTVLLPGGAYNLLVKDSANDGLEFWANRRGGSGYMRIEDAKGNLVKQFTADFGSYINYNFNTVEDSAQWAELNKEVAVNLYPTSTSGETTLDYFSSKAKDVTVQIITDEGAILVEEHHYKNLKEGVFSYDMSYRSAQRYYIKVFVDGKLQFNKRLRVVEARK